MYMSTLADVMIVGIGAGLIGCFLMDMLLKIIFWIIDKVREWRR